MANNNLDELTRIDNLTPKYRNKIESLSPQQRKIIVSLVRHGKPARICKLSKISRITQQNRVSSQVWRLVKAEVLEKQIGGYYLSSKDPDFEKYINLRLK